MYLNSNKVWKLKNELMMKYTSNICLFFMNILVIDKNYLFQLLGIINTFYKSINFYVLIKFKYN